MCDVKKLCTCSEVPDGADYWKLECHYGHWPSWGQLVETRPEHRELAEEARAKGAGILGPLPMPRFKKLYAGLADRSHLQKAVDAEADWLNKANRFDFDYQPFEGDRLMFVIGGEEIAFSYQKGEWRHRPHQAYSKDTRMGIDAEAEDRIARAKAAAHIKRLDTDKG